MARRSNSMSGIFDWLKRKPKTPAGAPPQAGVDLYAILGVPPTASHDEIKEAFRELAMKFHPDRNPNDPVAEKKYMELSTAYAILGDEAQRAAYDRTRPAKEAPPAAGRGLIPGGMPELFPALAPEEKPKKKSKPIGKSTIEKMFGPTQEDLPLKFDFLAPARPVQPPARIPEPSRITSAFDPTARRIPVMPEIDVPDDRQLWELIQNWHLDEWAFPMAREARYTPEFRKAGAIALDVLAGGRANTAERDIAEVFGLSPYQAENVVNTKGREAYYVNVIYPIFDRVIAILDQIKPTDLPGRFFLDWDPSGKVIEFFYAENIGRRP